MKALSHLSLIFVLAALTSCSEGQRMGDSEEEVRSARDIQGLVDAVPKTDLIVEAICPMPATSLPNPVGPLPGPASVHSGIGALEIAAFEAFVNEARKDPLVHFVATLNRTTDAYEIYGGKESQAAQVIFRREQDDFGKTKLVVTKGDIKTIFPSQDPDVFQTYDELIKVFENPNKARFPNTGYADGDVRIGYIPSEKQSYPLVLERIAALFDAPDAPDLSLGFFPWAFSGPGAHGGMSTLQSRSALVMNGPGVLKGKEITEAVKLVDVAPTVLALLDAPTVGGIGPEGIYEDGLYLKRQDGEVLHEVFDPENCTRPKYALIILFDGLLMTELLHQVHAAAPDIELPNFQGVILGGSSFRAGAIASFPSVSAPGHMTAGSGLWSGHHGFVANTVFRRETRERITAFALLDDVLGTLGKPDILIEIYDKSAAPGIETLAQAAHRAFGAYNPDTGEGAFTAVLNELPLGGADYTTVDFIEAGGSGSSSGQSVTTYSMADSMAVNQVETVLSTPGLPVPKILQVSLFATDAAGEDAGPHSDLLRSVLKDQDERLKRILNAYAGRGVLHETLIVLISDHGMELQDPTRNRSLWTHLSQSEVKTIHGSSGLFFLPTLEIESSAVNEGGGLTVTVRDHWSGKPLSGVAVRCTECESKEKTTDDSGLAVFKINTTTEGITLEASHPEYNPQSAVISKTFQ